MSNPEEIRRDIERTRAELSENVNALGDRSNPKNIARSQVDKVKDGAAGLKERVFGSPYDPQDGGAVGHVGDRVSGVAHDARDAVTGAAYDARDAVAGAAHDARDLVADAPDQIRTRTRGNPLAAGLVAAGIGALIGGLLPASRQERDAAHQLKEAAEPLTDGIKEMAGEVKEHLQPEVEQAVGGLKETAQEAVEHVQEDAVRAKDDVTAQAKDSADHVRGDAQSAADDTRSDIEQARDNM